MVSLLDRGDTDWVIVTNGKLWRLYSSKAHSRATNYYEIDLEEVLARLDPEESFRYFYLFFRKEAFIPRSDEDKGTITFLDRLLRGSEEYAKRLGERLKKRVFEGIFPHFAEGFISYIRKAKGVSDLPQTELDRIFQGTLTFLYRLLFILYAEARNLLPVKELRGYHRISLAVIKQEIAHKLGDFPDEPKATSSVVPAKAEIQKKDWIPVQARNDRNSYGEDSTELYDKLQTVFMAIDTGDVTINVPAYNGGLFMSALVPEDDTQEAENTRFLLENKIPDKFLAIGIDHLTRDEDEKTFKRVFIDYKSLGVRHLGSIYEGLLEFHLCIAPEKMAICKGKKTEEIILYKEAIKQKKKILTSGMGKNAEERVLYKGAVYLENTKHERKATGSYYTPDYIVKYIVENTVGPVLKERFEALTPKFREAQLAYREAVARTKAFEKKGMKGDDPEKTAFTFKWLVNELFDIKVLDPAMGSGHFLVEAVDFITDKMIDFLNGFPWNPVMATLKETRETILKAMEKQNITIDETRLNDLNLLKRHVLKRCIYGIDLNPMAVELAKVSLWLDCFTLGAPLSFLDHHLKCGNSLIGASVADVKEAVEPVSHQISKSKVAASAKEWKEVETINHQAALFGSRFAGLMLATDLMRHVGELSDVTATQVRESRAEYKKASDTLALFKRIFDIYVSQWFGNDGDNKSKKKKTAISPSIDFLRSKEAETFISTKEINKVLDKLSEGDKKIAETAIDTAKEKRFFHWELEFPEVFYGKGKEKENPGFDSVVGNPPYVATKQIPKDLRNYFWIIRREYLSEEMDYYELFIINVANLLKNAGYFGYICPNTFYTATSFYLVRELFLLKLMSIKSIVDFPYRFFPFEDVNKETCIIVCCKSKNNTDEIFTVYSICRERIDQLPQIDSRFFVALLSQKQISSRPKSLVFLTENNVTKRLEKNGQPLGSICQPHKGWMSIPASTRTPSKLYNQELFLETDLDDDKDLRKICIPCIKGEDIHRYYFCCEVGETAQTYVNSSTMDDETKRWHFCKKIIVQRITGQGEDRIIAAIDHSGQYIAHPSTNLINLLPTSKYNLYFILAILNTRLINKFYKTLFGESNTNITVDALEFLPMPKITFRATDKDRHKNVQILVKRHQSDYADSLLNDIGTISKPFNISLDIIHDFLSYLSEQMTEMMKKKERGIRLFLIWLENILHILSDNQGNTGINALTGKSFMSNYPGNYLKNEESLSFNGLMDILHKNHSRIGISLSDNKIVSNLKSEYEKSLTILLPIKEKLKKTDWLIDQIVYKLYGLTEEEIKIVEGREK